MSIAAEICAKGEGGRQIARLLARRTNVWHFTPQFSEMTSSFYVFQKEIWWKMFLFSVKSKKEEEGGGGGGPTQL